MRWGSTWAFATHAGVNPICFCCCPDDANTGGEQFDRDRKPNPFLRVKPPPTADNQLSLDGTSGETTGLPSSSGFLYATGAFDGRQLARRSPNSRWLGRRHREYQVPALDEQLVVALQKHLRIEEMEFLTMVIAITEDDRC